MSPTEKHTPLNILLVDDNDDHAGLIRITLRNCSPDFRITHLLDGESALTHLRSNLQLPPADQSNLILLDINLPGKSGLDVLEEIKADPRLRQIPVIMLTTSAAQKDRKLAYQRHANGYLAKPVDFSRFEKMIQELANYWAHWNLGPELSR